MKKADVKISNRDLIKRGIVLFLFIGILFSIIQDKTVLAYFLKIETIFQILFFAVIGGLLSSWVNYKLIKRINRKNRETPPDLENS